jgi:steroid delta-isomerase-like uncharacterized protein
MASTREVAHEWFEQVWNKGSEEAIVRLMSPTARFHGLPTPDGAPIIGPDAFKPFFHRLRQAFPDIRIEVERSVVEDDMVALHCRVTGNHRGEGLGIAPSGNAVDIHGMAMARIRDGRIVEAWNCFDFLALYGQVGLVQLPSAAR